MNIDGKKTFYIAENRSEYVHRGVYDKRHVESVILQEEDLSLLMMGFYSDPHQDAAGVAHPTPHSLNPVRNCSQMESVKDSFHAAGDIGCDVDVPECSTL